MSSKKGLLLLNLGTPNSPNAGDVKKYLGEFLMDPEVIDIPTPLRWLLVKGIILNVRPKKSAANYKKIWTDQGSPLLIESQSIESKLKKLGAFKDVALGMNYGEPTIENAIGALKKSGVEEIIAFPLFPQRATSTTKSLFNRLLKFTDTKIKFVESFHDHPDYISALAKVTGSHLDKAKTDHIVLSYHGVPDRHISSEFESCKSCLLQSTCQKSGHPKCYRRHCIETSEKLCNSLGWKQWSVAFQSRFGRDKWVSPFLVDHLEGLANNGIKNVSIACPSFVTDCLETLEEVGIGIKKDFMKKHGMRIQLIPCLNSDDSWIQAIPSIANDCAVPSTVWTGEVARLRLMLSDC